MSYPPAGSAARSAVDNDFAMAVTANSATLLVAWLVLGNAAAALL
jgi:hypothetical protein